MAELAALAAQGASSSLSALATLGSSLGTAKIQSDTALKTQSISNEFQKSILDRGEKAFTDEGLPKFLYYSGTGPTPNTLYHLGGNNFYEGSGVNSNLPYFTSSPYSQIFKAGRPQTNQTRDTLSPGLGYTSHFVKASTSSDQTVPKETEQMAQRMQPGLYSSTGPPPDYFTRGTQANFKPLTRSVGVQQSPYLIINATSNKMKLQ